jgi:hypothetical protein
MKTLYFFIALFIGFFLIYVFKNDFNVVIKHKNKSKYINIHE